jgi:predicted NAD/FAD-dependent oxidoreductase
MSLYSELAGKWDKEADVVVVGFGAAGTAAAITAQDAGASVLMLEKAPKGEEGGNTRVAGQGYLNAWPVDEAIDYFNALCGPFTVPQEVVHAWADEVSKNNDWLTSIGGDPQEHQHPPAGSSSPNFRGAAALISSTKAQSWDIQIPGNCSSGLWAKERSKSCMSPRQRS